MFGLGFGEIAIILVVALIVLGPSKLPELARGLGKGLREFRKATEDFKSTMDEELYKPEPPRAAPARENPALPAPSASEIQPATSVVPTADPAKANLAPRETDVASVPVASLYHDEPGAE